MNPGGTFLFLKLKIIFLFVLGCLLVAVCVSVVACVQVISSGVKSVAAL